jgi:hypothetical protein
MAQIITNFTGFETGNLQELVATGGSPTTVSGAIQGSVGGYGLRLDDGDDAELLLDPGGLKSSPDHFVVGFYIRFNKDFITDTSLVRFKDATETMGSIRIQASDMKIKVGDITSTYGTPSTNALTNGVWYKFEIRWYAANAGSGYGHLYIDDVLVASNTTGDFLGGAVPDRIRWLNQDTGTNLVDIDHCYVKCDTAASTTADLIGVGDGLEWNVPGYYQTSNAATSAGTAPAVGTLVQTGENPLNDTNEAEWTGSTDSATWAANGIAPRNGPLTDITDTVAAAKWWIRSDRDGGGGTTHTLRYGRYDPSTFSVEDVVTTLTTVITDYYHASESATYMPDVSDESMAWGITISGAQDLHVYEAGGWILQTFSAGPATIEGTLSETLGAFTVAGTAEVDIDAAFAETLGNFTTNPNATAEVDIDATLAETLGDVTVDATGTVVFPSTNATASFTLDDFTTNPNATAQAEVQATFAKAIADFTVSATGEQLNEATASITLDDFTAAGVGEQLNEATLAKTLDAVLVDATASSVAPPATATLAETLEPLTTAGTATVEIDATLSETLANFDTTTTVEVEVDATLSETLGAFTAAGTGEQLNEGTLSETLGAFTTAGTATVTDGPTGIGAFTIDDFTVAGTATADAGGVGAFTLGAFTVAGTADRLDEAVGAFTLDAFTTNPNATAEVDIDATGAFTLGEFTVAGTATGLQTTNAVGSFTIDAFTAAGTATNENDAVGSFTLDEFTVSATEVTNTNTIGGFTIGAFTTAGTATNEDDAVGSFTIGAFSISSTTTVENDAIGAFTIGAFSTAGTGKVAGPTTWGSVTLTASLVNTVALTASLTNDLTLADSLVNTVTLTERNP